MHSVSRAVLRLPRLLIVCGLVALASPLVLQAPGAHAESRSKKARAGKKAQAGKKSRARSKRGRWRARGCKRVWPLPWLKRSRYVKRGKVSRRAHEKALRYRVKTYGVPNVTRKKVDDLRLDLDEVPRAKAEQQSVRFFGHRLQVHWKVVPALSCVEKRIARTCQKRKKGRYTPRHVGGYRDKDTYRGPEVSNHNFGIAVDIDPQRNPCCHCVDRWQSHPKCKDKKASAYDRADLTRCWIHAFEHYGFYWLGRDALEDTMHFEFLGDPLHFWRR